MTTSDEDSSRADGAGRRRRCTRSAGRSPAEDCAEAAVYLVSDTAKNVTGVAPAGRRRVRRPMTATGDAQLLDREELRRLFDLRSSYNAHSGGGYTDDPYPRWHALREQAPVHAGIVHELTGYPRRLDRSRVCRTPTGRTSRRSATRRATPPSATPRCSPRHRAEEPIDTGDIRGDQQHPVDGRHPAPALPRARAAVVRAGQGAVVDQQLDRADGARAHRQLRRRRSCRAQRRLRAAIPVLTITGQLRRAASSRR